MANKDEAIADDFDGALENRLEELVDNALRFSPGGEPVRIRFNPSVDGVEARVIDGGPFSSLCTTPSCSPNSWRPATFPAEAG